MIQKQLYCYGLSTYNERYSPSTDIQKQLYCYGLSVVVNYSMQKEWNSKTTILLWFICTITLSQTPSAPHSKTTILLWFILPTDDDFEGLPSFKNNYIVMVYPLVKSRFVISSIA